jgi:hypothetical protein
LDPIAWSTPALIVDQAAGVETQYLAMRNLRHLTR